MSSLLLSLVLAAAAATTVPAALDEELTIELVAEHPQVVTPIGCDFDHRGRLLVIESHTHFPPENYSGPATDRILLFDDADGDGVLERIRPFHAVGEATMGIETAADGWVYVAQRDELYRLRDTDEDDIADQREVLIRVDSPGEYPHNGLGDLLLEQGWLYFGMGENLGQPYTLTAVDGSTQRGEAEGGNIFRCRPDGSQLQRVATGFWNPFGICFDVHGRLWTVGNDPDASPPCRLVHVIPGGDYGFEFRFGRGGTSPLQSWDGTLPGTLPMAAGTGEAPSGVLAVGDALWVTSWGDNRIERYRLVPHGASWQAEMDVIVQGDAEFRPVDLALAADGSVYVTDWVDRSYPVHGRGRIWRIARTGDEAGASLPGPTAAEQRARALADDAALPAEERIAALEDQDPFVWQAAVWGIMQHDQVAALEAHDAPRPGTRLARLAVERWRVLTGDQAEPPQRIDQLLMAGLQDPSPQVQQYAARWIAESERREFQPQLQALLAGEQTTTELFRVVVAAITHLNEGSARGARDEARERLLAEIATHSERPPRTRAAALSMLPSDSEAIDEAALERLVREGPTTVSRTALHLLADRPQPAARAVLVRLARHRGLDSPLRADALAGLAPLAADEQNWAGELRSSNSAALAEEATRVLRDPHTLSETDRPAAEDVDRWMELVGSGGDPAAGRRVFFRGQCAACHRHGLRGASVGPDLSTIGGQMDRRRMLESILQPAKEVGPMFVPWTVVTVDGRVLTGMKLDRPGAEGGAQFLSAEGTIFTVPLKEIESQRPAPTSIMPAGLHANLSTEEIRDLLAFLGEGESGASRP